MLRCFACKEQELAHTCPNQGVYWKDTVGNFIGMRHPKTDKKWIEPGPVCKDCDACSLPDSSSDRIVICSVLLVSHLFRSAFSAHLWLLWPCPSPPPIFSFGFLWHLWFTHCLTWWLSASCHPSQLPMIPISGSWERMSDWLSHVRCPPLSSQW